MTGVPGAALKNCHRAGWSADTPDHFRFLAAQLFTGGGVGSNYSAVYRERGQTVTGQIGASLYCDPDHPDYSAVKASSDGLWWEGVDVPQSHIEVIRVEDTREGWVDAWVRLIAIAHETGIHHLRFDLSDVRPHGAPLRSFGGRASGPAPLAGSIVSILRVLRSAFQETPRHLSALESMAIDHHIAAAVVSGGTRRSARMSQLNWNDPEIFAFIRHKKNDPSVSWSTNISVVVDDGFQAALDAGDAHATEVLHAIAEGMAADGEPGIYNLALAKVGERRDVAATNPCGEAILEEHYDPKTGLGSASGESCNLGSVDLDAIGTNMQEAVWAFELLARFLYRATLAPIADVDQSEIEDRNRRLGVGLMGLQGWVASHGMKLSDLPFSDLLLNKLLAFRGATRMAADGIAVDLGLPLPIKVTAVAPTGTIAQLRGTTSGIHPVYARYFVRRVQYSDHDPGLFDMAAKGYHIEDSIYAAHTKVVAIPVKDIILERHPEELVEQADEVSVDSFLEIQGAVQSTFCGGVDGQAISATANIPATGVSADHLAETLKRHLPHIKGATVFPAVSRPQTPITSISKEEWEDLTSQLAEKVMAGDSNDGECVGGACPIR
jgi:ribonucleoside-triphosphate reductase